ncbi:metallopeptidase TldD-related protein [Alphaproteobacteria bacterium]|nr:metallopeptidase TldD-related protein [Alphaproteobacteria bacterium]
MLDKLVKDFSDKILDNYKKYDLDDVEISVLSTNNISLKSRNLKIENIERSKNLAINVNIYKNKRKATISSNNIENSQPSELLERASAMVKSMPIDNFCGLPDSESYANKVVNLDLEDKSVFTDDNLLDQAKIAEEVMLQNKKITNTEGASRSYSKNTISLLTSKGFEASYTKTFHSLSCIAIAGKDTNMQRDYEYSAAIHASDMLMPSEIGKKAAERASSRLDSKKIKSCTLDIVFEPRVAKSILSSFASCASGASIARKTSFLNKKLKSSILDKNIIITNNPRLTRGLGSKPYDNDGIENNNLKIVNKGILENYFLATRNARQLNLTANGNSSPSNLILENGTQSLKDLISGINNGFLVTEMLGMSFNPVNGDYSRGAAGFKIDKGEVTYPVSEVTIAGNMLDMLINLTPANDLEVNDNINSPSILIENMTLAGL